ncbi:MAG: hypothetical protein ACJKTH_03105 [Patescibacteria group bacterium UBA2163]
MIRALCITVFIASIIALAPWWVSIALGILLIAYFDAVPSVLIGGLLLDVLHSAPIHMFGGFAYLYTGIFIILIIIRIALQKSIVE